jgi:hypothetical protein
MGGVYRIRVWPVSGYLANVLLQKRFGENESWCVDNYHQEHQQVAQAWETQPGTEAVSALLVLRGARYVRSPQTPVGEILQEAHQYASAVGGKDVDAARLAGVAKLLKSNQHTYPQELEEILGRTVDREERSVVAPGEA